MNSTPATRADLDRLGLTELQLGALTELSWPPSDTSHALGHGVARATTFAAMLAVRFVGVPFAPVSDPILGPFQLEISRTPARVLKISAPSGVKLQLYVVEGDQSAAGNVYAPPEDIGSLYIDTAKLPRLVVRAGAAGLAVGAGSDKIEVQQLLHSVEVSSLEPLEPPVEEWLRTLDDRWLEHVIASRLQERSSWARVVAAGMIARLPVASRPRPHVSRQERVAALERLGRELEVAQNVLQSARRSVDDERRNLERWSDWQAEPAWEKRVACPSPSRGDERGPWSEEWQQVFRRVTEARDSVMQLQQASSATDARSWIDDLNRATVDPLLAGPRRWVRSLSRDQSTTMEDLSLAEVEAVHQDIEAISTDVDDDMPGWTEEWRDVCHRRDDLECVLVLLDEIDRAQELRRSLTILDKEGNLLRLSVPANSLSEDERARRAALKNPGAWWTADLV